MSEPNDTVTDSSPICPWCGKPISDKKINKVLTSIEKYDFAEVECEYCDSEFSVEMTYTTKKL